MQGIDIFTSEKFGSIRAIEESGRVLFCASDVARALGYARPNDAVVDHCRCTVKRRIPTVYGAIGRHCRGVVKREGVSKTTNQHGVTTEQEDTVFLMCMKERFGMDFSVSETIYRKWGILA